MKRKEVNITKGMTLVIFHFKSSTINIMKNHPFGFPVE